MINLYTASSDTIIQIGQGANSYNSQIYIGGGATNQKNSYYLSACKFR